MTTDKLNPDVPEPEKADCFIFVPMRYYLAMWFFSLPPQYSMFQKGGNFTALIWRKLDQPEQWHFRYRFRHYVGPQVFGSQDVFNWYGGRAPGAEASVLLWADSAWKTLAAVAGTKLGRLDFRTTGDVAMQMMKDNPPYWMKTRIEETHAE